MKKTILSIAVITAAIFTASCQKENLQGNTTSEGSASVFTATIETVAGTKTTVERVDGTEVIYKTKWESTDQISINGVTYTATPDVTDATKATFTKVSGEDPTGPFNAYFPANLYNNGTPTLPANVSEEWADIKYNMPMYATSTTTSLSFKNLCGVLKITVTNAQLASVKSITVSSTNCATSGAFTVSGDAAVLTDASNTANTVTVTYTEAVTTDATGKVFYVAVPAQTYHDLTIVVSDGTDCKDMVTKSGSDIEVERNKIYPITFKDNTPYSGFGIAVIKGVEVHVPWVQLWENGPKFADRNVGASSATDVGSTKTFTDATNAGANYVWGANWCTPSKGQMDELLKAASSDGSKEVECVYTQESGIYGFKFTGKGAYDSNSVFFPAQPGYSNGGDALYWSCTANDSKGLYMRLYYVWSRLFSDWEESSSQDDNFLVRPVLKN